MWYCEVEFVSGKTKIIIFRDEVEANDFFDSLKKNYKNLTDNKLLYVHNNGKGRMININNIESVSEPEHYVGDGE